MSKQFSIKDHKNAKAFVINGPKGTAATFYYGEGIAKKEIKKGASTYCKTINQLSK